MADKFIIGGVERCYANHLKIGQNAFEFLLDFGQFYRNDGDEHFQVRIVTTPVYAKAFLRVLQNCVNQHEQAYGDIPEELPEAMGQIRRLGQGLSS